MRSTLISIYLSLLAISLIFIGCGNDDAEAVNPDGNRDGKNSRGGIYDIGASSPEKAPAEDGEYQSPFGPRPIPRQIAFAPSLTDACNRAKADENIKVLMWITSDSCPDCKRIEKEIFTHEEVRKQSMKYIWVKFDADSNPERKRRYIQNNSPPALIWFDVDGNSYQKMYGGFDDIDLLVDRLRSWH